MQKKRCRKCKQELPLSNFSPDRLGKYQVGSTCKSCSRKTAQPTGEKKIFDQIVVERCFLAEYNGRMESCVRARDYDLSTGEEIEKIIPIRFLTVWNFSHKIPKSRGEEYRLDKENIEIVSMRFHYREHNGGNLMTENVN